MDATAPSHSHEDAILPDLETIKAFEICPLEQRLGPETSLAVLADAAARHPNLDAVVLLQDGQGENRRSLTYAGLLEQVYRLANLLDRLGAEPAVAIGLILPNAIEMQVALIAASAAAIASPINPHLREDHMSSILRAGNARILIVPAPSISGEDEWQKLVAVARNVPSLQALVIVGAEADELERLSSESGLSCVAYSECDTEPSDRLRSMRQIAPSDIATYFHTGGTTGAPKLAMQSHRNQAFIAWAAGAGRKLIAGERIFCGLPLFHVNGAMLTGLHAFRYSQTVIMLTAQGFRNPQVIGNFWRLVDAFRPTTFSAVPTVLTTLLNVPLDGADISSLGHVIAGAAPLSPDVLRRFEQFTGVAITEGYGLTESSCVCTVNPVHGEKRAGSVGLRLPYTDVRISADGGKTALAQGEAGNVLVRGPHIFLGYNGQDTGGPNTAGWFDTGDIGRLDADGYLWLTGRAKDLIIRGGHNIDPGVIEEALSSHPAVQFAAAVGLPDVKLGERPMAFVSLRSGASVSAEELHAHASSHIAERAAWPNRIEIVDAMPLTSVGKIFKVPLREVAARIAVETALAKVGLDATITHIGDDKDKVLTVWIKAQSSDHDAVKRATGGFTIRCVIE